MESLKSFGERLQSRFLEPKQEKFRRMTWNIPDMKQLKDNLFKEISGYVNKEIGKMSGDGKIFSSENN